MKVDIKSKEENALLGRTSVDATITFEGPTPSRSDTIKAVASATGTKTELVVIKKIDEVYGGGKAQVSARIYKDAKALEHIEREYMRTRNVVKEEPKEEASGDGEENVAEAPTEEAKEDAPAKPAEEKKEGDA